MSRKQPSIATLVITLILVSVSLVLGCVGAVAYHFYSAQKWAEFDSDQALGIAQLAIGLAPPVWNLELPQISRLMDGEMQDPRTVAIVVDLGTQELRLARGPGGAVATPTGPLDTDGLLQRSASIVHAGQVVGKVSVLASPRQLEDALAGARRFITLSILLFDLVLCLGLYLLLSRLVLQPLRLVEAYAVQVSRSDSALPAPADWRFSGELQRLKTAIDAMVRQLAQQNAALQQAAERLRQVVRLLPMPIGLSDRDDRVVLLNDHFVQAFGYTQADVPTLDAWFARAYPDADQRQQVKARWRADWDQAGHAGRPVPVRTNRLTCKDGSVRIVEVSGMQTDALNIAVLNDITERTRAEQELRRYREHLEELVQLRTAELRASNRQREEIQFAMDHAGIAILRFDATSGRLSYANANASALFNRSEAALMTLPVGELLPVLSGAALQHPLPLLQGRDFARLETMLARADAPPLPVELLLYAEPPQADTRGGATTAFLTDISLRQASQQALVEAKQAAEAAAQARSAFLANMSHEIRTPMNAIIGMSQLALQTALDSQQRNYIQKTYQSATSLLGILNDILDLSKIEADRLEIEHVGFQLERVFDNLANLLAQRAEEKGVELLFDIAPGTPSHWLGDPLRLGQILINLAGNAIKFTDRGSVVVGCRTLAAHAGGATLEFAVRDSGVGMDAEQQGRLFAPFTQGDNSISRRYGGTGLGLAICKRLAALMQGRLTVDSRPGEGSTFCFIADFERAAAGATAGMVAGGAAAAGATVPQPAQPPARVLVVDDNPLAVGILCGQLAALGLAADGAASADAALALLGRTGRPGLVVADGDLPGAGAAGLLRALQASQGPGAPPVILVTGVFGTDALLRATAAWPVAAVLTRPVTPWALRDAVAAALGGAGTDRRTPAAPTPGVAHAQALAGLRVLLVEDNPVNQEVGAGLLAASGAQVVLAGNGREGLDRLARGGIDLVLMDVQMPVMDGLQASRAIRSDPRLAHLPIIAMTAGALPEEREQTAQAGMDDHVTKPIDQATLVATLVRWLPRPAVADPAPGATPGIPTAAPAASIG